MIPARQLWLQLGARSHFDLLHGRHGAKVALAFKPQGEDWKECGTTDHATAAARVLELAARRDADTYLSQSGFASGKRVVAGVAALPVAFVDLDTYTVPGLQGLSSDELLDRVLERFPWLPVPTMTIASGRGHYLEWCFTQPLTREHLPRWQAVEDALVLLLSEFGADPKAKDAARVLRIVDGVNQRNGAAVVGYQSGAPVSFPVFERLVLDHAPSIVKPQKQRQQKPQLEVVEGSREVWVPERRVSTATAAQRAQFVKPYQLASDRMADCSTLARLRGSPRMQDCRHRLLYVYAVSGAWYWADLEQAEAELQHFAREHFDGANRYQTRRVQTVLDRMEQQQAGKVARVEAGMRLDWRYQLRNQTIVASLGITPDEQRQLRTIIGKDERQRRRTERRRQAGMVDRGDYLSKAQQRRQEALEMRSRGMSQAAIARELGVSQPAVCWMLKRG